MNAKKIINYLCGECGMEWSSREDADGCCSDATEKITWMCSPCGKVFETEHDANECCANRKLIVAEGIEA